jgi:hypothetical protein
LHLLRISDGISIIEHLNVFNTMIISLLYVDIKITKEEKYIGLLCYFPDSWDSLVVAIKSNATTLTLEDVVLSVLSKEMRWNNMEGLTKDALMVRAQSVDGGKGKLFFQWSKSKGRYKSSVQLTRKCWKCDKDGVIVRSHSWIAVGAEPDTHQFMSLFVYKKG